MHDMAPFHIWIICPSVEITPSPDFIKAFAILKPNTVESAVPSVDLTRTLWQAVSKRVGEIAKAVPIVLRGIVIRP